MKSQTVKRISLVLMVLSFFAVVPWMAFAETDVTGKVELIKSGLVYDRRTKISSMNVSLKNISQDVLLTPIKVVIDSISITGVTVANADGITGDGKPYFQYSIGNGQLLKGLTIPGKAWSFFNPANARFSYTTHVLAFTGVEIINGVIIPPIPDSTSNKASIKGVDSNNNGLRDDVERFIAKEFGPDAILYEKAKEHAITLQGAIINPTPETISVHLDSFRCISDNQRLSDFRKTTIETLNTPERRAVYGKTFAGTVITKEGCQ